MSTLESAICFTLIIFVLSLLILFPVDICADTLSDANESIEDVLDTEDQYISPEQLNTFLTGISENYRIIYGTFAREVLNEE